VRAGDRQCVAKRLLGAWAIEQGEVHVAGMDLRPQVVGEAARVLLDALGG
jgi:hypothetical protein